MAKDSPTLAGRSRRVVPVQLPARAVGPPGARPSAVRIVRSGQAPAHLHLEQGQRYLLGRHDAAEISFDEASVSRIHGVLASTSEGWVYEDHESSNGSVLLRAAGNSVLDARKPVLLGVGDVLELGNGDARIELVAEVPLTAVTRSVGDPTMKSTAAVDFQRKLDLAARTRVPVFLLGPSGCGKTHAARQVHIRSSSQGAFVPINCARLPSDSAALHSELLGHVRGAFTGADQARKGKLVHADGGTLFLDEVESLSPLAQGFLLDVLEGSGDLAPLGSGAPKLTAPIFRLISASKQPLGETTLRDDLCERLAEGHLWRVPTLHERTDDIPGLIARFASEQSSLLGVEVEIAPSAVRAAVAASWPGQIRQLRATVNVLAQLSVASLDSSEPWPDRLVVGRMALEQHLHERDEAFGTRGFGPGPGSRKSFGVGGSSATSTSAAPGPLSRREGATERVGAIRRKADARALNREHLVEILDSCEQNQSEAARRLGIARNTLARKMKEFDLK